MPMIEEFAKSGNWLFRWRSYLPLFLIAIIVSSLHYFGYPYGSHYLDNLWELMCLGVSFIGLAVRILTVGYAPRKTSGGNTKRQVADILNTKGMYSVARHPLYLGNFILGLGVFLFLRIWFIPLIYALAFALYYERIMFAEEMFLREKFSGAYMEWASRTPSFLPKLRQWKRPDLDFSWKAALKREYQTFFTLIVVMFCMETLSDSYLQKKLTLDPLWVALLGIAFVFYCVVRAIRKWTKWLHVQGR